MADTLLSEKKTSTKKVEKSTDENSYALLYEKKPLTRDVEKGTDELAFKKQKVHTIRRKGLNQFEGKSIGTHGWFKLNIDLKKTYSKSHSEFYKELFKNNIDDQDTEVYEMFVVPFDK